MRIYYSGNEKRFPPEKVVDRPNIMISFAFLNRKKGDHGSRGRIKETLRQNLADSVFIDSGAFSLYLREGQKGCNYDYFSLRRGADFRRYCDRYASFLLKMRGRVLAAFGRFDKLDSNRSLWWHFCAAVSAGIVGL